jgi:hypothetical protein
MTFVHCIHTKMSSVCRRQKDAMQQDLLVRKCLNIKIFYKDVVGMSSESLMQR